MPKEKRVFKAKYLGMDGRKIKLEIWRVETGTPIVVSEPVASIQGQKFRVVDVYSVVSKDGGEGYCVVGTYVTYAMAYFAANREMTRDICTPRVKILDLGFIDCEPIHDEKTAAAAGEEVERRVYEALKNERETQ